MSPRLQACLARVWGRVPAGPQWRYGQVPEWDSLGHLRLIAELEAEYELQLSGEELLELLDLEALSRILARHGLS